LKIVFKNLKTENKLKNHIKIWIFFSIISFLIYFFKYEKKLNISFFLNFENIIVSIFEKNLIYNFQIKKFIFRKFNFHFFFQKI